MYKFIIVLFLFTVYSCQALQNQLSTYAPDVFFKAADLKNIDMSGVDLDFTFSAKNKVPIPINFSAVKSQISVDGQKLFNANLPQGIQLKANSTSDFKVSQRIDFKDVSKDLLALFKKDQLNVQVDGTANFAMGKFGNADVPIKASKLVPVPKVPDIKVESFKFVKNQLDVLDPKALFELKFNVTNPNKFGVDMNFIKYSFVAENKKLVDGDAPAMNIGSNEQKSYTIPITLQGKEIITLVPKLKDFPNLNYKFNGNMNMNAGKMPVDLPFQYP